MSKIKASLATARQLLEQFEGDPSTESNLVAVCELAMTALLKGGKLLIAGNGGSHADALHFAEELTGKFSMPRAPIGALALGEATHLTCVGNDFGFAHIFERQVRALAKSEDLLILLSTSGNSENLILAAQAAKELHVSTVGFLGRGGGKLDPLVDFSWVFPGETSDRIQELHMLALHILVEAIESKVGNL